MIHAIVESREEDAQRARMLLEEIKPWINPLMWKKMEESKEVRKNILESEDFKDLGGWYLDEEGNLKHPLIDDDAGKEKRPTEEYHPSFGPAPEA
jgi:hypothetical protein